MQTAALTPEKAAFRLTKLLNFLSETHGDIRFPVDVEALARNCHEVFQVNDPIAHVIGDDIPGFDGCLSFLGEGNGWALLYNNAVSSAGRIRFTQAHELGHYILHRLTRSEFQCTADDMDDWQADDRLMETEADKFAANLLMPLDDFRQQVKATVDFEQIGACAERYGVSLTAAALRWVSASDKKLVLVASIDGFVRWSVSTDSARAAGAFLRARRNTIELPAGSLSADETVTRDKFGTSVQAKLWFPDAHPSTKLREMKIASEQYGVLSLLELPSTEKVWAPWESKEV